MSNKSPLSSYIFTKLNPPQLTIAETWMLYDILSAENIDSILSPIERYYKDLIICMLEKIHYELNKEELELLESEFKESTRFMNIYN